MLACRRKADARDADGIFGVAVAMTLLVSMNVLTLISRSVRYVSTVVGFGSICHQLEDELANACSPLTAAALAPLQERWDQLSDGVRKL